MRTRTRLCLLACCCAALAACTAAAPKGPDTSVSTPAVGRPPAPASLQAALSSEAFTPYTGLSVTTGDGLAPGDTIAALHTACMNDAGYGQYANNTPWDEDVMGGLAFEALPAAPWGQPYGPWGYVGTTEAEQEGFNAPAVVVGSAVNFNPPGLPAGAQAAAGECLKIVDDFDNAQFATSMAGMVTMSNDIYNDVGQDPDVKNATKAWSACMARNGYPAAPPAQLPSNELRSLGVTAQSQANSPGSGLTPAQNRAQIASAVADAHCTLAADLAGIFFAVQASYEQQVVSANQQALGAGVRRYKASYAKELSKLTALLRTTSATPARKP
jgi:hypothetical protein